MSPSPSTSATISSLRYGAHSVDSCGRAATDETCSAPSNGSRQSLNRPEINLAPEAADCAASRRIGTVHVHVHDA